MQSFVVEIEGELINLKEVGHLFMFSSVNIIF